MSDRNYTSPREHFFKAGGLPYLYTIILIILNLLIITFTAPQKGYGGNASHVYCAIAKFIMLSDFSDHFL